MLELYIFIKQRMYTFVVFQKKKLKILILMINILIDIMDTTLNNEFIKDFLLCIKLIPSKYFYFPSQKTGIGKKKRSIENINTILKKRTFNDILKLNMVLSHLTELKVKNITKNNYFILLENKNRLVRNKEYIGKKVKIY